jgi:hypothetical protein
MKRIFLITGFVVSILIPSTSIIAQNIATPLSLKDGESLFFGYIDPYTHGIVKKGDKFNEVYITKLGGLIGGRIKSYIVFTFRNVDSNELISIKIAEEKKKLEKKLFAVSLPRGIYSLSINHLTDVILTSACLISSSGKGNIVYIGDLSLHEYIMPNSSRIDDKLYVDWINCVYNKQTIDDFIDQNPEFKDHQIEIQETICGEKPNPDLKILGKWKGTDIETEGETFEFLENGVVVVNEEGLEIISNGEKQEFKVKGEFSLGKDDEIRISLEDISDIVGPFILKYKLENDTLKLSGDLLQKIGMKSANYYRIPTD